MSVLFGANPLSEFTLESGVLYLGGALVFGLVVFFSLRFFGRKKSTLNQEVFQQKWLDIQRLLVSNEGARLAIIEADKLVDEALRQLRISGTTMGERLVAAQRMFTSNDSIWAAHKLRNKLVHEQDVALKKEQIKDALIGFKRALRDLGAL